MTRFWWSEDPLRHLRAWADQHDYRTVTYLNRHDGWTVTAHDLEPCPVRGGMVAVDIHGTGRTAAAAADECLTRLAQRAVGKAGAEA